MDAVEISPSSLDRGLNLLASQECRRVLRYLIHDSPNPVSIDEVVSYIVDTSTDDHAASRKAVRIELHHRTFPRLETHGLIDYDWKSGDVRYHSSDRIETLLGSLPDG